MGKIIVITEDQLKQLLKDSFLEIISKIPVEQNVDSVGDYIEEKQASQMLGRKTTWFYNMRISGKLPYTKVGSKTFYSKSDLLKIMENNRKD
jgi:hypothetical protein